MSKGFIVGGSTPLNFKVMGGAEQPLSPRENTIWVNTEDRITSWIISVAAPEEAQEGMVWLAFAAGSSATIDALKRNSIIFCITTAKQYIEGVWEQKDVCVYQQGEWKHFETQLINDGIVADAEGWEISGYASASVSGNYLVISTTNPAEWSFNGYYYTKESFDLTYVSKIEVSCYGSRCSVYVGTSPTNMGASVSGDGSVETVVSLDVSEVTGERHIGFYVYGSRGQNSALYTGNIRVRYLKLVP